MPAPRSSFVFASALAVLAFATACDSNKSTNSPNGKGKAKAGSTVEPFVFDDPFPDEAAVEAIAARPAPELTQMFGEPESPVDHWTMHGAGAQRTPAAAYEDGDRASELAAEAFASKDEARTVSPGLQCAAAEFGHFALAHGAEPAADVRGFILARCGSLVTNITFSIDLIEPKRAPKSAFTTPQLRGLFARVADSFPPDAHVGLWAGRSDQGGAVVRVYGQPRMVLEPVPLASGKTGYVELRGEMQWDAQSIVGYATVGEQGYSICKRSPGTNEQAPRFALRCRVDPNDERAMIELQATPRGRIMSRRALQLIVSPKGSVPDDYQAPQLSLPIGDERDGTAWATAVTALRRSAELSSVSLSVGQTDVAQSLLPHLLAALRNSGQAELLDQIAMGLIAGRKIDEDVGSGTFFFSTVPRAWTLERELAAVLQSPHARSKIFDPDLSTLAVASLANEEGQMRSSVIAGYTVLRDRDYSWEIAAFFDAVDRHRVARGLEPVIRVEGPNDRKVLEAYAGRVRAGEIAPSEALDALLDHFVEEAKRDFHGIMFSPYAFLGWEPQLEGTLVEAERVAAAVTITHFVPDGAAWGRYLVLVTYTKL
ncbi:MAG: hypothetical protein AAF799_06715 [Myxococcota bacterium]